MAPHVNESCKEVQRNEKTHFRSRLKINSSQMIFRPDALKMTSKETYLDPNIAVSPEKQLSWLWRCKPSKYYTALPKLNMQAFAPVFLERIIIIIIIIIIITLLLCHKRKVAEGRNPLY